MPKPEKTARAIADNVMVTPTVIRSRPAPETRVTGNFRDIAAVIDRLGLTPDALPIAPSKTRG